MIRVPARVRLLVRIVAMCSLAAVVLASCAANVVAAPHATGLPAISISVPLSNVACTTDNSCAALGTSPFDVTPTSVGEYRSANGRWTALVVPNADSTTIVETSSCWNNGCLFVGSQSNGDLVWRYDGVAHSLVAETPPAGGSGIDVVSCYSSTTCAILDSTPNGMRFLTTGDGGTTWSSPVTVGPRTLDSASALSCSSKLECMVSILDSSDGVAIYVSSDGGATWTPRTGFSTVAWSSLSSLHCVARSCLGISNGLANQSAGWRIVRTENFGRTWKKVASLAGTDVTLACVALNRCVVGGTKSQFSTAPWLATVVTNTVTTVKLKYVPSPISDIACGSKICVAIGVTTVVTFRP